MAAPSPLSHENLSYKHPTSSPSFIRKAVKANVQSGQKCHRERLILSKRLKVETLEDAGTLLSAQEEYEMTESATKLLKSGRKVDALTTLHRALARDESNAKTFIKLDGLPALIGCFFAPDSEILHAAAWCAINLTAGMSLSLKRVKLLSPILFQFLQGSDVAMQELCAWALGNIAGDSASHKDLLVQQGCVPALTELVSKSHRVMYEARTHSVLFALANIARGSYDCVRCLQEHCIYKHIVMMMENLPVTSQSCSQLGWLINSIYFRTESFTDSREQFSTILPLVLERCYQINQMVDTRYREKLMLPFLRCLGNLIGQSEEVALEAGRQLVFYDIVSRGLSSRSTAFVHQEILWILSNFIVEPSCCVLVLCQPSLLTNILNLCPTPNVKVCAAALHIVERMTHISTQMSQYLFDQEVLMKVCPVLSCGEFELVEKALDIFIELLETTSKDREDSLKELTETPLQMLLSPDVPDSVSAKAKRTLSLL
ncbi:importin subunit alpha-9 isoform X2 [Aplysia californica]|uniref:Importin subunit alpha-9 isoform X2 n=1 Tax=Aplysia californica TaxID=6500 RepID=A0ABM0JVE6_APLCA|nr:importin subunit alpha-9 isoform X2 [Aplysia californica]